MDAPCQRPQTIAICTTERSPVGNALLFFAGGVMSLLCLPCSKFSLAFLAVPAGKDGRVECPRQTVDDFIGVRGSVCGLFLFVQTHAPLIVPPWQSRARKSKFQFHIRRKGADVFRPALAVRGLIDGLSMDETDDLFFQTLPNSMTFRLQNEALRVFFCIDKLVKTLLQTAQRIFQREIKNGSLFYFAVPHRFSLRNL